MMDGSSTVGPKRPQRIDSARARELRANQPAYERGKTLRGIGARQRKILAYIMAHPGCAGREVDKSTNALYGLEGHAHFVTYDAINRLIARGLVGREREAFRSRLYLADDVAIADVSALIDDAGAGS
jgi:hypothetical protein